MDEYVILEGVVGSTAYGLDNPDSDIDRLGIFLAPTRDVLGLNGRSAVDHSHVTHTPSDRTLHELAKFLKMALGCNPTVMELLWLPGWETITGEGRQIVDLRHAVLSTRQVRATYGGYATAQARRLLKRFREGRSGFASDLGHRTDKHGRHCARLLTAGRQLLETGELVVNVGGQRDELFELGELAARDPEAFYRHFEAELARLDTVVSVLPDEPAWALVNEVLVAIRQADLAP